MSQRFRVNEAGQLLRRRHAGVGTFTQLRIIRSPRCCGDSCAPSPKSLASAVYSPLCRRNICGQRLAVFATRGTVCKLLAGRSRFTKIPPETVALEQPVEGCAINTGKARRARHVAGGAGNQPRHIVPLERGEHLLLGDMVGFARWQNSRAVTDRIEINLLIERQVMDPNL